jgi:hypothetical protein
VQDSTSKNSWTWKFKSVRIAEIEQMMGPARFWNSSDAAQSSVKKAMQENTLPSRGWELYQKVEEPRD